MKYQPYKKSFTMEFDKLLGSVLSGVTYWTTEEGELFYGPLECSIAGT